MDDNELICIALLFWHEEHKKKRRYWVHPLNLHRLQECQFYTNRAKLRKYPDKFFDFYRMSMKSFDELLGLIKNKITRQSTWLRNTIDAEERLTITLRFLATGMNFEELKSEFMVGSSTISKVVKTTLEAIWEVLMPLEMRPPASKERWLEIANFFYKKTNFPNCLGAVDGKHIRLINPMHGGSNYYNYKTYFSIVLMAIVDADYRFIGIDVGAYGKESDGNIFNQWTFGKRITENQLNVPGPKTLPASTSAIPLPHVFVGDEAFALNTHFLRPYPRSSLNTERRVFNYRLSRARRLVECAFGILSNKWRIFHKAMTIPPDFAVLITKTACVLHNFVRARDGYNFEDTLTHYFDNNPHRCPHHRSTNQGRQIRDQYAQYFMTPEGEIPWQYQQISTNNEIRVENLILDA